ncbi:hypothetical protein ADU59_14395 [Pararhizobium polonicum]|uniref:HTH-type transcriptional regulator TtuA n=1 Tax=Pararhizobium polonicum TaxID=1612624 RepID=A0A1C7P167_9HYPH|nr:LysR family transcriptional regulator [Pararhizobium polonicum]OBZ94977.1 hypothetical protein ADU59_14395 [Pararhizobium polonicum]
MSTIERAGPIRIFLTVCGLSSFAAAADRLHLSPSAVAKAVARLEDRLGVRLFERTTRRLNLTQEGERYRDVCRRAFEEIDAAEDELAATRTAPSGLVRVNLPPLFGMTIIAPALFALSDRYPLLSFEIVLDGEKVDLLSQRVDVAVRIGALPDVSGLTARKLGMQTILLCASPYYLAEHGMPETVSDLAGHALIATSRNGRTLPWSITGADGVIEAWMPPARLLLDGSALTLAAIKAGHGIGLLPEWLAAPEIASGALRQVMPGRIAGHLPIHVIWPSAPVMLPRLRATIDAIVAAAGKSSVGGRSDGDGHAA